MKIDKNLFPYFEKTGMRIVKNAGEFIYMEEEDASTIFLITKGRVRVYGTTSSGREVTYEVLDQGRIFGESAFITDSTRPTTVSAVNQVELIACKLESLFPYLMESKELTLALLKSLSEQNNYITEKLKKAFTYNRFEKVASFLLEQAEIDQPTKGIIDHTLPYSHEEIAGCLGLSRVTVTKVLNEFADKGYVKNEYRKIRIINLNGLKEVLKNHGN